MDDGALSRCVHATRAQHIGPAQTQRTQFGELRKEVWARWLEHDPVRLAEKHAENLHSLKLLYIDAGTRDEFSLDIGAKILSRKLKELGIPQIHEEFDDGHFNISYRYDQTLELISEKIES